LIVLFFSCTGCKETIRCPDHESVIEIFYLLVEHIKKCRQATFTCDGTTEAAAKRLNDLRSTIEAAERLGEKLQLH